MDDDIKSELTFICKQFLEYIKSLYNQGLVSSDQYWEMAKLKIEYLEDVNSEYK